MSYRYQQSSLREAELGAHHPESDLREHITNASGPYYLTQREWSWIFPYLVPTDSPV